MTARLHEDHLIWWLLSSVFALLTLINVALAVTEDATWPYALAVLLLAASVWTARQGFRPSPSSDASGSTVIRTERAAPGRSRSSRLGV